MKRTRRIEITRYRRRVTVSHGEASADDIAEERLEGDLILDVLQSMPPMPEEVATYAPKDNESEYLPVRRSLSSLGKLFRPRKRT